MPTYDYHCQDCAHPFEVRQSIAEYSERRTPSCPHCGSTNAVRRFTPVNLAVGGRSDDVGPAAPSCEGGSCCCG
jgi:putative FmdB family regulatory protein